MISEYLPTWLEQGINVIITSDHGMTEGKSHGGLSEDEILVPFSLLVVLFRMKMPR